MGTTKLKWEHTAEKSGSMDLAWLGVSAAIFAAFWMLDDSVAMAMAMALPFFVLGITAGTSTSFASVKQRRGGQVLTLSDGADVNAKFPLREVEVIAFADGAMEVCAAGGERVTLASGGDDDGLRAFADQAQALLERERAGAA